MGRSNPKVSNLVYYTRSRYCQCRHKSEIPLSTAYNTNQSINQLYRLKYVWPKAVKSIAGYTIG